MKARDFDEAFDRGEDMPCGCNFVLQMRIACFTIGLDPGLSKKVRA